MKKLTILALTFVLTMAFATAGIALKKDVEFEGGSAGKVVFSHEQHTEKVGLKCNECHPKIFHMKKGGDKITMDDIKAGKFCGECHNGTKAFAASAADSCPKCHQK
jgi:c(7)-type cytochrome triheme protein